MSLRIAVVTISDSSSEGKREDRSGPAVTARLRELGYNAADPELVPDERAVIADLLRRLADSGEYQAIFTTGGTGITARDVTPEATRDILDREIPGIAEVIRFEGRKKVRTAPLSRALAGSRGAVLVVNLPGSPTGAVESLDAIVELVPHIANLLQGRTEHL